jgi:hypothetical protein
MVFTIRKNKTGDTKRILFGAFKDGVYDPCNM